MAAVWKTVDRHGIMFDNPSPASQASPVPPSNALGSISIVPYPTGSDPVRDGAVDRIFFAASGTQSFQSDAARAAFRERWLGRYLDRYGEHAVLALDGNSVPIGYLVGALEDPAQNALWSDIGYFDRLADLTAAYPAHLHINIDAGCRGRGIGAALIGAFVTHAATRGATGVHVVTGAQARNVGFYASNGFGKLRIFDWKGNPLVMLGRIISK